MGDRDWISRVAAGLAALFILAGYAIPWCHVDVPSRLLDVVPPLQSLMRIAIDGQGNIRGSITMDPTYRIDVFIWGVSAYIPAMKFSRARQVNISWFELQAGEWERFFLEAELSFVGSFVCYLFATILLLLGLGGKPKRALPASIAPMLVSLILFVSGVSRSIGRSATWYMGPYLCVISLIFTALSRVTHFSASEVGHALVEMLRSERVQ